MAAHLRHEHRVRSRRSVAVVRELWYARDDIARERDISPGRVLPDAAIVEIAKAVPKTTADLPRGHRAHRRATAASGSRRCAGPWRSPRTTCRRAPCPPTARRRRGSGPRRTRWPPTGSAATRAALTAFAEEHVIPVENVCSPDPLRRVVWQPPSEHDEAAFIRALLDQGARPWQAEIVAPMLVAAFAQFPGG